MQFTDSPSLAELEASRQKLIESIQEAEDLNAKPEGIRLLKTGLKHIEDMIEALRVTVDG
jgi:hypothetical protein